MHEPLITYHPTFTGRTRIDSAFARAHLKPMVALEAIDSDVIKTYVRLGMGVGIVAEMAVRDDPPGGDLVWKPAGHLFGSNLTRVAFKRGAYLRQFVLSLHRIVVRSPDATADPARHERRRRRLRSMTLEKPDLHPMNAVTARTPSVTSRLPQVGTTIFTVMSALATQHKAVNLGQGFPDFDCDPALLDAVNGAMRSGLNQYPPMAGVPVLRDAIARKIEALYGGRYDAADEITITAGATQAILTAILCAVHPGDEVIVLEPYYDSYVPNIELAGGRVVRVALTAGTFRPDFDAIGAAITPRTRAILVNTPHNPSATVWTRDDLDRLAALLRPTDILLIADEVYEHMVFDGVAHASASGHPELAARAFVVSSFGKTYHVTGWKVGYVAAPTH